MSFFSIESLQKLKHQERKSREVFNFFILFIETLFFVDVYNKSKQKIKWKNSDLYSSLYTNSYTNGVQYTDMYADLHQPNMGKINCLKTNLYVKNININT